MTDPQADTDDLLAYVESQRYRSDGDALVMFKLAAEVAAARAFLTEFAKEAPYAAEMYDDPRCCYCRVIIGVDHTDGCLVYRARAWLAGSIDPEVSP